jgi:hypothetical protein
MIAAFKGLLHAINSTGMKQRSSALDKRRVKEYWGTGREMSARSFESYIIAKLKDQGAANDYLANIVSENYWKAAQALGLEKDGNTYPYLEAAEIPAVRAAFDHFFNTVETKQTDKGVAMFAFAGPRAKTADKMAMETAEARLEKGDDADAVRRETGWFIGADGKWRFEINDVDAKLKNPWPSNSQRFGDVFGRMLQRQVESGELAGFTVGDLLDHPALFAAYPRIAQVTITTKPGRGASYARRGIDPESIRLGDDEAMTDLLSILLHEIQHAIQHEEGFARGGTPESAVGLATDRDIDRLNRRLSAIAREKERLNRERFAPGANEDAIDEQIESLTDEYYEVMAKRSELANSVTPYDAYERLGGEVEARNVQARAKLSADERRATPPSATQDVSDSDVIVVLNGEEMAIAPANAARQRRQLTEDAIYRGSRPAAGMKVADVRAAIAPVILTWGDNAPAVEVVDNQSGLPEHIRRQIGEGGMVQGVHDSSSGTVYIVAGALANKKDAMRILAHEAVGHFGLEESMGDTYQKAVDRVKWLKRAGNKKILAIADRVASAYPGINANTEAREILAHLAEERQFGGVFKDMATRIYAAVRQFLRRMGFKVLWSTPEIDAMLARSARYLRESGGRRRTISEALEHPQLGEIDVALGKGRMGASKFVAEHPEIGANLEDMIAGSKVVSRDAETATLENGGATFDLIKRAGRWVLTDARADFARDTLTGMTQREGSGDNLTDSKPLQPESEGAIVSGEGEDLVTLYHGTSKEGADSIRESGRIEAGRYFGGIYGVSLTPRREIAEEYADDGEVIVVKVPRSKLVVDPESYDSRDVEKALSDGASVYATGPILIRSPNQSQRTQGAGVDFARKRTMGASGRAYSPAQEVAFENTGRTVTELTWKERAQDMVKDLGMKLRQGIADQFAPIADLDQKAYILARLSKASDGALEAFMLHGKLALRDGVYDADMSGGVVDRLLKPLKGEMDDFMWWVAANRAERLAGEGREHLFTPQDIAAYKSLASGQSEFDYTLQHNNGPNRAGSVTRDRALIYRDAAKTLDELNKNVMDLTEQSGLIDGANRAAWEREFYIPFYRAMEDGVAGPNIRSGLARQYAFKQLKGGSGKLNTDLLANTLMNWAHLLSAASKNRAAKASLDAAERIGVATQIQSAQKGSTFYRENGKEKHFLIEDPFLMDAVTALEFNGFSGPVMKVMGKFKHYLTVGVTANPTFKVRNLIRDSLTAIGVSSDLEANPLKNLKQGFKATSKESQTYVSMLASGGLVKFGTMLEGNRTDHVRALVDAGVDAATILDSEHKVKAFWRRYIKPAVDAYNDIGDRGESINRAALYEQMTARGMSHAEASLAARDLLDFSMGGTWTAVRLLTSTVPFMNARIQGLYKLGRSDKKRLGYVVGAVSLASLALLAAYGDDDDWKQREDWDRDTYWWFKFGGVAFRIPKPFEIGAIGTLAERSAELFFDNEMTGRRYMERVGHLVGYQLSMNPMPQIFKPILDVYANRDSFTGRPIETMGMDRLRPEDRYTARTSEMAKIIGKSGLLSPVQADHLVRGYFGWLGAAATTSVDMLARSTIADVPPAPAMKLRDVFLAGNFVETLPANGSRYVSQLYDQSKEIEQAMASFQHYRKLGETEKARRIMEENKDALSRYKIVSRAKKMEADLNRQIRLIEASRTMSKQVKRDLLDGLYRQRDAVARMAAAKL